MGISETKKQIVIDNYFEKECDVNTSIKDAFTKGFELGLRKALTPQPKTGHWIRVTDKAGHLVWECDKCGWQQRFNTNFCPDCGARMIEPQESEK